MVWNGSRLYVLAHSGTLLAYGPDRDRVEAPAKSAPNANPSDGRDGAPKNPSRLARFAGVAPIAARSELERVTERRRAVALAEHYRSAEGLSIAQIAVSAARRRRSKPTSTPADRTDANKGLSLEREAEAGGRELRSQLGAAAPREGVLPRWTLWRLSGLSSTSGMASHA